MCEGRRRQRQTGQRARLVNRNTQTRKRQKIIIIRNTQRQKKVIRIRQLAIQTDRQRGDEHLAERTVIADVLKASITSYRLSLPADVSDDSVGVSVEPSQRY